VLTDPAACGPVTLSLCQDVQAEAFAFPAALFAPHVHRPRRPAPDVDELARAAAALRHARRPLIVAGGGVLYADAAESLARFADRHGIPVAETQAGKGALPWDHPQAVGGIGVTGSAAANTLAREADAILAIGTRLADFTTGSRALLPGGSRLIQLNVQAFDAAKHGATALVGDARVTLTALDDALGEHATEPPWRDRVAALRHDWRVAVEAAVAPANTGLPSDAQVLGVVNRTARAGDVVVCAAGGLPGELHKLWRAAGPGSYHLEYGFSCMGYEIAGGLGVKLARPDREVFVLVGDGSYLMMNSELQTSVMTGHKLIVTVLDNHGFGCIDRLQRACGGQSFNNLIADAGGRGNDAWVDFASHAASLGARSETVASLPELEAALARAREADRTSVIVIATDPAASTAAGGAWWDVAVPEVSARHEVQAARAAYEAALANAGAP
jgi:3D-(3,5/4)-trihydroxycyclohexane-1,2-dione acylhydrolase (decyclizing)